MSNSFIEQGFNYENENFDLSNTNIASSNSVTCKSAFSSKRYLDVWIFQQGIWRLQYMEFINHHNKTEDDFGPTTVRRNYFGVSLKIFLRKKQSRFFFGSPGITAYCQTVSSSLLTKYSSGYRKYITWANKSIVK